MLIPQYFSIALMLSIAIFPQLYLQVIVNVISGMNKNIVVPQPAEFGNYISIMQHISWYSMLFIGVIMAIWGIRTVMLRGKLQGIQTTWQNGYTAVSPNMQYTGKSFSKTLSKTFNFVVIERKQYEELKSSEIFPKTRKHSSHYHDFFEFRFIHIITNQLIYAANYFKFIQNGRIQSYVLYGIVFILFIFILTAFNIVL